VTDPAAAHADEIQRIVSIRNERGLHARAAAKFVRVAERFDAQVSVRKGDMTVSGNSIMGLMMLAAGIGTTLELRARGREAGAALDALTALIDNRFDET
jgi:phosphocarrier protein HPr